MKPSNLKEKRIIKLRPKLTIEEPNSNSKFKNKSFQRLYERNNASRDRLNTTENKPLKKDFLTPRSTSNYKVKAKKKSKSKMRNFHKDNKDYKDYYQENKENKGVKSKKIYRVPYNNRKYKNYPNLINSVLQQANYYNTNNNNNFNENVRYKPIEYIFTEQSEKENMNNSGNISINSENQNELKSIKYNDGNNIRKIKIEDNNENYNDNTNTNDNLYKINDMIIEKNGKTISPIISSSANKRRIKNEKNDIISKYINNIKDNNPINNEENNNNVNNINLRNENKIKNISSKYSNEEVKEQEEKKGNYINSKYLEIIPTNSFALINKNSFPENKLIFNNNEEVLSYIKNKIKEEKDIEYNQNKNEIKYNYFILSKIFHGKTLYEIGLSNNINQINSILEKENVEIEHQKVIFITQNEYKQLKQKNIQVKNSIDINEEIKQLSKENEELKNRMLLSNKNYEENYSNLENEINKKQNIINEYAAEREKFLKYINELQEYDKKVILEYQKMKLLLEKEKEKNFKKYFTNEELEINKNDLFDIINQNQHYEQKNIKEYEIKTINQIFLVNNEKKNDIKKEEFVCKNKNKGGNNYIYEKNVNNNNFEDENNKNKNRASFSEKRYDIKDKIYKSKRDESLSRAMKRINNRRKIDKIKEEQNKFRKSKKINGMAGGLQDKIKNNEGKFYVDLEYEKNKEEEYNNY